jgi:hypothetical protein
MPFSRSVRHAREHEQEKQRPGRLGDRGGVGGARVEERKR